MGGSGTERVEEGGTGFSIFISIKSLLSKNDGIVGAV